MTAAPKRVAPQYEIQVNEYIIPTKVGKIYARIAHPVDSKGKIKEIGYFLPYAGSTSAVYWVTDDIAYAVDYNRGIDILRFKR